VEGWGEWGVRADKWQRSYFPTQLRAFISSRDNSSILKGVLFVCFRTGESNENSEGG
jgi:hypothetical protein